MNTVYLGRPLDLLEYPIPSLVFGFRTFGKRATEIAFEGAKINTRIARCVLAEGTMPRQCLRPPQEDQTGFARRVCPARRRPHAG